MPEEREAVRSAFVAFWTAEREAAIRVLCTEEHLDRTTLDSIVADHSFTGRAPTRNAVVHAMKTKPRLLERRQKADRVVERMLELVEKFDDGIGGMEIEKPMSLVV